MNKEAHTLIALTQGALTGLLASESGENTYYGEVYTDPNTGRETSQATVQPLVHGVADYTKPPLHCHLLLTRNQHIAREAVAIAKATAAELDKLDV